MTPLKIDAIKYRPGTWGTIVRTFGALLLLIWMGIHSILFLPHAYAQEHITISSMENFPPYNFEGKNGTYIGIDVAIIEAVLDELGISYTHAPAPWKRAIHEFESGQTDMLFQLTPTAQRFKEWNMVGPIRETRLAYFVRQDSPIQDVASVSQLKGYKVGTILGYTYFDEFMTAKGFETQAVAYIAHNVRKLTAGRIDIAIENDLPFLYESHRIGSGEQIRMLPSVASKSVRYAAFRKDDKGSALAHRFQQKFDELHANGTIPLIIETWSKNYTSDAYVEQKIQLSSINWEPYTGETLPMHGFFAELVTGAFARVGYHADFQYRPWARALSEAKSGHVHGVMDAYREKDREAFLDYPGAVWQVKEEFIALKNNPISYDGTLSSLKNFTIGVLHGSTQADEMRQAGIDTVVVNEQVQSIRLLLTGRIDATLIPRSIFFYHAELLDPQFDRASVKVLSPSYKTHDMYVAFSKQIPQYEQLTTDFNRGLRAIRADGTYQKIIQKHEIAIE